MTNRIDMCINCFQKFKASTLVIGRFSPKIQQHHHIPLRSISLTTTNCNHYLVLGVANNATDKEIKKAYLAKCQKYHPDKHPNNPTMHSKFVQVNEAYQVLGNKTNRREYDNKMNFYRGIPNRGTTRPNKEYDASKDPQDVYEQHRIYKEFYDNEFGSNRHNIPNLDPVTSVWNKFKQRKERTGSSADKKFILKMYSMVAMVVYFAAIFAIYMRGVNMDRMTKLNRQRALQSLPEDHPAVIQFQNSLKGPRTLDMDINKKE